MAKKDGLLSSLKAKIWAGLLSSVAAITGSGTLYFWNALTGQNQNERPKQHWSGQKPGGNWRGSETPTKQSAVLQPASFTKVRPLQPKGTFCAPLGCRVEEEADGLHLLDVPPSSYAAQLGFVPGDVIEAVNNFYVQSVGDVFAAAKNGSPLRGSMVMVRRGDNYLEGNMRLRSEPMQMVRSMLRPVGQ